MISFQNIIEHVFLTNQKMEINMPQILGTKCIVNVRKDRSKKKFRFGEVKMARSNKIKKLKNS